MSEGGFCIFNVVRQPTAHWIVQQLRDAFPDACPYRYVILDRDSKFNPEVIALLKAVGSETETPERSCTLGEWTRKDRWGTNRRRAPLHAPCPLKRWSKEAEAAEIAWILPLTA
jgi:hypothetical protein